MFRGGREQPPVDKYLENVSSETIFANAHNATKPVHLNILGTTKGLPRLFLHIY